MRSLCPTSENYGNHFVNIRTHPAVMVALPRKRENNPNEGLQSKKCRRQMKRLWQELISLVSILHGAMVSNCKTSCDACMVITVRAPLQSYGCMGVYLLFLPCPALCVRVCVLRGGVPDVFVLSGVMIPYSCS